MATLKGLFFGLLLCYCTNAQDPIVNLPNGQIRGTQNYTDLNNPYFSFQRIPYAAPPVGDLRFKPPVPAPSWEGILDTTYLDVLCYQLGDTQPRQSEDCLYMNVYTPQLPTEDNDIALPVLLYIYGGGFTGGDAGIGNYGPDYLLNEGIVVASFNYRSGPFGFLSTQDDVIPGNYGLKDQQFAIQWVHDNIALFGGDPNKITIQGQSSGAAGVTLQLLHKQNEGLFRGGIAFSGTAVNAFSNQRRARSVAFDVGKAIDPNFNSTDSRDLLELLLTTDAGTLNSQTMFSSGPVIEPDIEEAFVTDKMYQLVKNGDFIKVPLIVGYNSEECIGWGPPDLTYDGLLPEDLDALLDDNEQRQNVLEQINNFYFNGTDIQDNEAARYRYCSDNSFIRGILKFAELASNYTNVYLYRYNFVGTFNGNNPNLPGIDRVAHADELVYIWHHQDFPPYSSFPEADQNNHNRIVRLLGNFVKEGNPTPESDAVLQNIIWPIVNTNSEDLTYLDIEEDLSIDTNPRNDMYQFWKGVYDSLDVDDILDTY